MKTSLSRFLRKSFCFAGGLGFLALWLIFGYAAELICNSIGFIYPAYASVKAIESKPTHDDTKWLMYVLTTINETMIIAAIKIFKTVNMRELFIL